MDLYAVSWEQGDGRLTVNSSPGVETGLGLSVKRPSSACHQTSAQDLLRLMRSSREYEQGIGGACEMDGI